MAERPQSRAKRELRDIRADEEKRLLAGPHLGALTTHAMGVIERATIEPHLLAEDAVWLPIRNAFIIAVLLLTGLRRFEACSLACGDVDLAQGQLWVVGKGRVRDFTPLADSAVMLLRRWLDVKKLRRESTNPDAPLFAVTGTGAGSFLSLSALRLVWKQTLRGAGVPDHYGVHSARHAAGMLVFGATGSIERTARFLRHRSTKVTSEFYLHIDAEELRREISQIDLWRTR